MMQEQLAAHQIEWEVVETPSDEEETAQGVVFDHFGYRSDSEERWG